MNDERMISQTPRVHKLDEVSSWCLTDCSKYVRESQWRRMNVVSHVDWSFLLLGGEERECVLCHVCWLDVLLASGEARRGKQDRSVLLERPAWKRVKECYLAFLLLSREVTRAECHEIFSLVKNMSSRQNSQNIPVPDNNLKFFLQQFLLFTYLKWFQSVDSSAFSICQHVWCQHLRPID